MNIVFYILLFMAVIGLWFLLSFTFPVVGAFLKRIFKDTIEIITSKDKEE